MTEQETLEKATLQKIKFEQDQSVSELGDPVKVQFNPETLKVNYSNEISGDDQAGGSAIQFVSKSSTKLSMQLWFDVTILSPDHEAKGDVRNLTKKINAFLKPEEETRNNRTVLIPPAVRFIWGTFLFEGIMTSIDENLEFFSSEGKPLRASISVNIISQDLQFRFNRGSSGGQDGPAAGRQPLQQAAAGDTIQKIAARSGNAMDWKSIAAANNIENPRLLKPGTLINTNIKKALK